MVVLVLGVLLMSGCTLAPPPLLQPGLLFEDRFEAPSTAWLANEDADPFTFVIHGWSLPLVTDAEYAAGVIGVIADMAALSGQSHIAIDNLVVTELP